MDLVTIPSSEARVQTPQYGEYPYTSVQSHHLVVAATDSCFVLIRTHRNGTAPGERSHLRSSTLSVITEASIDFLKVLRFSFPVPLVGPTAKDFYHLQRAKFAGGIFLL